MNWFDILLLVILAAALVWGLKTGILQTVFVAIGVVVGWWLAGRYADDVGGLAGSVAFADSLITAMAYWIVIALATLVVVKIGGLIRTALNIGTLGAVGMTDRIGGVILGGIVGLVVVCAVIIMLSRLAFDFTIEVPTSELPGRGPGIVSIENQREALVSALTESSGVSVFMSVRDALPESMLGLVPDDFDMGLDILDQNMG
ncbi:MAG: CvpA family protein [Dehalococcoidia bacterium]|nr:CvpA family protein [Dehalococcoidia bacterium]